MKIETQGRINSAVKSAQGFGAEIEEKLKAGTAVTDPEISELMTKREAAITDAETWKAQGETEDREALLTVWANELSAGAPVVEHEAQAREDDPTATKEYQGAFRKYLDRFKPNGSFDESERQILSTQSDPAGGYTVPSDHRLNIIQRIPAFSRLLGLLNSFPTSRDEVVWTRVAPHGTAALDDIYTSAFVGTMVGELPATADGDAEPVFGRMIVNVKKARSKARLAMDLASDSEIDIMGFLRDDGALNLALLRESQVLNGNGIGKNVKGLLQYAGTGAEEIEEIDISGTTANAISNTIADAGSTPKIIDWIYSVPAQYRAMPSFAVCMNSQSFKKIRKLIDANGNFIWAPGFAGMPDKIEGFPLVISEFMPDDGTDTNRVGIAGAFDQVVHPVRAEIAAQVLLERYADTDEVAVILRQRFGAAPALSTAFKIAKV